MLRCFIPGSIKTAPYVAIELLVVMLWVSVGHRLGRPFACACREKYLMDAPSPGPVCHRLEEICIDSRMTPFEYPDMFSMTEFDEDSMFKFNNLDSHVGDPKRIRKNSSLPRSDDDYHYRTEVQEALLKFMLHILTFGFFLIILADFVNDKEVRAFFNTMQSIRNLCDCRQKAAIRASLGKTRLAHLGYRLILLHLAAMLPLLLNYAMFTLLTNGEMSISKIWKGIHALWREEKWHAFLVYSNTKVFPMLTECHYSLNTDSLSGSETEERAIGCVLFVNVFLYLASAFFYLWLCYELVFGTIGLLIRVGWASSSRTSLYSRDEDVNIRRDGRNRNAKVWTRDTKWVTLDVSENWLYQSFLFCGRKRKDQLLLHIAQGIKTVIAEECTERDSLDQASVVSADDEYSESEV